MIRIGRTQTYTYTVSCLSAQKYLLNKWMNGWMNYLMNEKLMSKFWYRLDMSVLFRIKVLHWDYYSIIWKDLNSQRKGSYYQIERPYILLICLCVMLSIGTHRTSWIQSHFQDTKQSGFDKCWKIVKSTWGKKWEVFTFIFCMNLKFL